MTPTTHSSSNVHFLAIFLTLVLYSSVTLAWSNQYVLPTSGIASTTQFTLGPELVQGTSCGAAGWPSGMNVGNPTTGQGPGLLYAAINQLAFGANPSGEIWPLLLVTDSPYRVLSIFVFYNLLFFSFRLLHPLC